MWGHTALCDNCVVGCGNGIGGHGSLGETDIFRELYQILNGSHSEFGITSIAPDAERLLEIALLNRMSYAGDGYAVAYFEGSGRR
jgi:hypothetical protein